MKFNCGPDPVTRWFRKKERLEKWHLWFAWHPVRLHEGDCRWLEFVERKGSFASFYDTCEWNWEYRAL